MDNIKMDDTFAFMMNERAEKPRTQGLTMVMGEGTHATGGLNYLEDLLSINGPWIDWYKFVWSAYAIQDKSIRNKKLNLLEQHDIRPFTGGNFLEEAVEQGKTERFFDAIVESGSPAIEVSTGVIDITLSEKAELIETAVERGLDVHGETGRKASKTGGESLSVDELIEDIETCLNAGADTVIIETEEIVSLFDISRSDTSGKNINEIINTVGAENIMFEIPTTPDLKEVLEVTGELIDTVGSDVNLGNVKPQQVSLIEQKRRGIGP